MWVEICIWRERWRELNGDKWIQSIDGVRWMERAIKRYRWIELDGE
ncbi:hypothetical protein A2U01_0049791, partial [Trifolium medium]|nr:hypothetical protein [Trifolium medium]